jgi:hypothetical protein
MFPKKSTSHFQEHVHTSNKSFKTEDKKKKNIYIYQAEANVNFINDLNIKKEKIGKKKV